MCHSAFESAVQAGQGRFSALELALSVFQVGRLPLELLHVLRGSGKGLLGLCKETLCGVGLLLSLRLLPGAGLHSAVLHVEVAPSSLHVSGIPRLALQQLLVQRLEFLLPLLQLLVFIGQAFLELFDLSLCLQQSFISSLQVLTQLGLLPGEELHGLCTSLDIVAGAQVEGSRC